MRGLASSIASSNRASLDRYEELGERLSEEELSSVIDPPWTEAALFAHVAFWDRFVFERWRITSALGERTPAPFNDDLMDLLNDALLPQWLAMPPRAAVAECLAAAARLDEFLGGLDPVIVAELVEEGRERLVDRSLHRREHLRTIERSLPAS